MSATVWSDVDRVALCVHRPSGSDPIFRRMVHELHIPARSFVVSAARHLAAGRLTLEQLELLSRYESRTLVSLNARRHVDLGLVREVADGVFAPSEAFRLAARTVLAVQGRAAEELWSAHPDVPELAALAAAIVDRVGRIALPVRLRAFSAQRADHDTTPPTPHGQLLAFVTELRYLRSDLHAHALAVHGLAGPTARAVDRIWKGHPVEDDDLRRLVAKALVVEHATGQELSEAARVARIAAQEETERLSEVALASTPPDELLRFARGLAALPGEDPRPMTDR